MPVTGSLIDSPPIDRNELGSAGRRVSSMRFLHAARFLVVTAAVVANPLASLAQHVPDIPERARGAERVVVASIRQVNATREQNEYGDDLIVSHASLAV